MNFGNRQHNAIVFLRVVVAALMIVHGVARIYFGTVDDFGGFLAAKHFPAGFYLAWAITIFEIVGGFALALGYFVIPLSLIFAVELLCGILLVHLKEGWFVVGAGRNGVEYSVLLIAVFLTLAISQFGGKR